MSEMFSSLSIRSEKPSDLYTIHNVNLQAFGGEAEANLVDLLRQRHADMISLVAEVDGQVAGHIFYSPVTVETNLLKKNLLGLAPLAVLPAFQNRGIGKALILASFEVCRSLDVDGAVVLGSPVYYPRFGFSTAANYGLSCVYPVPPEDFMAIAFKPNGLEGCSGTVHYHPTFTELNV